jgi:4'-phosphopantetheinyl transferase
MLQSDCLAPGRVDIWVVTLADTSVVAEDILMSTEDRIRYTKIIPLWKKRNFAFRRSTLNFVLKQYVSEYKLIRSKNGKNYVETGDGGNLIHFSSSSSSNICAIAVSTEKIGIDMQSRNSTVDMVGVCERFLPNFSQMKKWPRASHIQQMAMSAWCRIESLIKLRDHTLHAVLTEDDKSVSDWIHSYGHSDILISDIDYLCAISQERPFNIGNIYTFDFEQISRGYH